MTSSKVKKITCGVYIDGSNIFGGQKEAGWWIDFDKLKKHLKSNYRPLFFNYYGGVDKSPSNIEYKKKADSQQRFYDKLNGWGYNVITKPLKYIQTGDGIKTKCDMDVEISMDMRDDNDSELIIIFTGDSDYCHCLNKIHSGGKFIRIYSFKERLSWELKDFAIKKPRCNYRLLDEMREEVEYVKNLDNNNNK
ncbi:MAG: NYN domain-containing protein [Candidatus Moraniibacteriota bacterium]